MTDAFLLAILLYNSVWDIKKKVIPVFPNIIAGTLGVAVRLCTDVSLWKELIVGILVGGLLLLAAIWSEEAIGKGDGLLFLVTGCWLSGWRNFCLLITACFADV